MIVNKFAGMHFSNMVTIFRLPSMYFVYLAYVLVIYDELSPNNEMSVDCFFISVYDHWVTWMFKTS